MIYLLLLLAAVVTLYLYKDNMTFIPLDENNRMIRIGAGFHDGHPFFRIDLWSVGIRWS